MKLTTIAAVAVMAIPCGAMSVLAQASNGAQTPAELPAATYRGNQYVDSTGCVFIRADIDGAVTWVPRVNRLRQALCGQTPTFAATTTPAEPPVSQATKAPAAAPPTAAKTRATPPVTAGAPAATRPEPSSASASTVFSPATALAADTVPPALANPRQTTPPGRTAAKPSGAPAPTVFKTSPGSGPATAAGGQVPQQTGLSSGSLVATSGGPVTAKTRVLPKHVHENVQRVGVARVPAGYRPAWDDDRLNPRRAEQTLEGIAQTRQIWTNTVPRRLITPDDRP